MNITTPQTRTTTPEYFHALDGVRGLLALLIAVYHTVWRSNLGQNSLLNNGPAVVDIFFVLSGFIMYRLYCDKLTNAEDALSYMKKRFARIYPLHLAMLLVMVVFASLRVVAHVIGIANYEQGEILPFGTGAAETMSSFFGHLTLTHSMGVFDQLSYNVPSWSISAEFFAYLTFAVTMVLFRPKKGSHILFICAGICLTYYSLAQVKPDLNINYDLGFVRCLAGFFTGVVTAWVLQSAYPKFKGGQANGFNLIATLIEIGAVCTMLLFISQASGTQQFFIAPFAFVFVFIFALGKGSVSKCLSGPICRYLGKISYSIYMVHFLIAIIFGVIAEQIIPKVLGADFAGNLMIGNGLVLVYLAVVLFVSHFTYHQIEVRGRKAVLATDFSKLKAALLSPKVLLN